MCTDVRTKHARCRHLTLTNLDASKFFFEVAITDTQQSTHLVRVDQLTPTTTNKSLHGCPLFVRNVKQN